VRDRKAGPHPHHNRGAERPGHRQQLRFPKGRFAAASRSPSGRPIGTGASSASRPRSRQTPAGLVVDGGTRRRFPHAGTERFRKPHQRPAQVWQSANWAIERHRAIRPFALYRRKQRTRWFTSAVGPTRPHAHQARILKLSAQDRSSGARQTNLSKITRRAGASGRNGRQQAALGLAGRLILNRSSRLAIRSTAEPALDLVKRPNCGSDQTPLRTDEGGEVAQTPSPPCNPNSPKRPPTETSNHGHGPSGTPFRSRN